MPNHTFTHRHRLYGTPVEATTFTPGIKPVWWLQAAIEDGLILDEESRLTIVGKEGYVYPTEVVFADEDGVLDCMTAESFKEHFEEIPS